MEDVVLEISYIKGEGMQGVLGEGKERQHRCQEKQKWKKSQIEGQYEKKVVSIVHIHAHVRFAAP